MHALSLWCGFLGGWLLVAGPLYQAALQLEEEQLDTERLRGMMADLGPERRVSGWWWLLPPVKVHLDRRRRARAERRLAEHLSDADRDALRSYVTKARGWLLVGAGGTLIAVKETWELAEGEGWPVALFWFLVVAMALLSFGQAGAQTSYDERTRRRRRTRRNAGAAG